MLVKPLRPAPAIALAVSMLVSLHAAACKPLKQAGPEQEAARANSALLVQVERVVDDKIRTHWNGREVDAAVRRIHFKLERVLQGAAPVLPEERFFLLPALTPREPGLAPPPAIL